MQNYLWDVVTQFTQHIDMPEAKNRAKLLNQMMFSKLAHLKEIIKGVSHVGEVSQISNIIDPTVVGVLVRNIFETVAMFNVVYVQPKTDEDKLILYNLWAISGYKYRQKFEARTKESIEKSNSEAKIIDDLVLQIEQTDRYKQLNEKNQGKIKNRIDKKEYLVLISEDNIQFLNWQDVTTVMGVKSKMMDTMYNYFSLFSHPSNVSVFQFGSMFNKESNDFLETTTFHINYVIYLTSFFIADYIKVFPTVKAVFNNLPEVESSLINTINSAFRGESYVIHYD